MMAIDSEEPLKTERKVALKMGDVAHGITGALAIDELKT